MYRTLSCRLKVFEDNYNDETRLKFSLAKIEYANPVKEGYVSEARTDRHTHTHTDTL